MSSTAGGNTPGSRPTDLQGSGHTGRDLGTEARDKAREIGADARDMARDVRDEAISEARDRADATKEGMADEISDVSRALRKASDELRDGSPQARTFSAAADMMASFADTVHDRDLGQMADSLSDLAKRNPVAFLGGAALLGFAGARMAKTSRRARMLDRREGYGGTGYGGTATATAGDRGPLPRQTSTMPTPGAPTAAARAGTGTTATGTSAVGGTGVSRSATATPTTGTMPRGTGGAP